MISLYQKTLSPFLRLLLGPGCRYEPTCSEYAQEALKRHGLIIGGILSFRRFLRCHPWSDFGSDPVPAKLTR